MTIRFDDNDSDLNEYNTQAAGNDNNLFNYFMEEQEEDLKSNLEYDQDYIKYSVQVVDNYDKYPLEDITSGFDDNSIFYNSPLSTYNQKKDLTNLENLTNEEILHETVAVMSCIADRMNNRYFSNEQENVQPSADARDWFKRFSIRKSINSIAKFLNWIQISRL